jgi:hypothetical protein
MTATEKVLAVFAMGGAKFRWSIHVIKKLWKGNAVSVPPCDGAFVVRIASSDSDG